MSEETKLTGPVGWAWAPYYSEGNQVLHDVLVVGSVQRFYDEGPCYGQALGNRTGPISTDAAARERVEREVIAALAPPLAVAFAPTHRHKKRGAVYRVIGEAEAQVSTGSYNGCGYSRRVEDGSRLTVYEAEDGRLWARFPDEFEDGRFERLPLGEQPAPPPSHDLTNAPMAEGKTALTHSLLAERCAYLAKVAAAWAGDLLSLPEQNGAPVPLETVERFLSEMRERLDRIELAGSSRGNG